MRPSILLGVAGLCLACAAGAAEPQQLPRPLTLERALAWAEQYNPTVRGARIELRRRKGGLEHADVPVPSNPRLELETAERERPGGTTTSDIGIRLSQELWIAGQGGLREAAAESRLSGARSRLDFLRAAVRARVRAAFLETLAADRAVATAEDVVAVNERLSGYARKRLETGEANRLQANTARIGLARARALLAEARNRRRRARLQLAELLAVDPTQSLTLSGSISPSPLDVPDRGQLLRRAVQRRGDLAAAGEEVDAARQELELARRRLVPNLRVFGFFEEENRNDVTGGGVSFELPLLHRYGGERKQAAARLDAAHLEQDTLQRTVRAQVLRALSDYRAARERFRALNEGALAAARENFELTERAFEAGEIGASALATAQQTLMNTRRDYLDALDALVTAGTDLERATGGLVVMGQATAPDGAAE